jgi:hypothetical protein
MVKGPQGKWVVPNPQVPRSFGIMNIVFGSLLLLVGAGYGCWYAIAPTFSKNMQIQMQAVQARIKAEHDAKIDELKKQEAAAKTKEEKDSLQAERVAFEQRPVVNLGPMSEISGMNPMADWRLASYYFAEVGAGLVLNLLMIISGIALVGVTEWGRRLGMWVAWLKIFRWIAMIVAMMVLVLPAGLEMSRKAIAAAEAATKVQGGGTPIPMPFSEFARVGAIFGAVFVVFSAIIAVIYPAMLLWYLSRPAARAACMKQPEPKTPEPESQWETTA